MAVPNGTQRDLSFGDFMGWIVLAPVLLAVVIPLILGMVGGLTAWLVDHHVLVTGRLLIEIPGTQGAGLDLARLVLLALSVVACSCLIVLAAVRQRR